MSLKPLPAGPIPPDTARVARAAFPKGSPLLTLRDELGVIFDDEDFAACYPAVGQPAYPPWRLALVTVLQFREDLSDRQAAEAARARIVVDPGSTGSISSGSTSATPASTPASWSSSETVSSSTPPSTCSSTASSLPVRLVGS